MAVDVTAETHEPWVVLDAWEDRWQVSERRPTKHGFSVLFGRPAVKRGRGGKKTIVTRQLLSYLETRRYPERGVDLPLGFTTVKRLRKLLGHDWLAGHAAWWEERIIDMYDLTVEQFAERHDVLASTASMMRSKMIGANPRKAGWWREPEVRDVILSDLPVWAIADELGLAVGSIRRMRWMLQRDLADSVPSADER